MKQIFINLLAFGSLLSSVLVITSKNPVIAVIFLISVFINAAGYLILLGIGFIGISYILVYIGAITVLFLFTIMLLNIKLSEIVETSTQYTKNLPLALGISLLFIFEFFTIMPFTFNNVSIISYLLNLINNLNTLMLTNIADISSYNVVYNTINPILADSTFTSFTQIQALGINLYTFGSVWLIITSVILLLAMIAPIFVSKPKSNYPLFNNSKKRSSF
jgi:NADH-ubiquinone oxidoreductase chain 6